MSVLDRPRMVMIQGEAEEFNDYEQLDREAHALIVIIQRASADLRNSVVDDAGEWSRIERLSGELTDILAAKEIWLAEHDAEIAAKIEEAQNLISGLSILRPT